MVSCSGATRTPFLTQMHADVCGIPIVLPKVQEATAFGSAITAAVGAGFYGSLAEAAGHMVAESNVVVPDMGRYARYNEGFEFYLDTPTARQPPGHRMARRHEGKSVTGTDRGMHSPAEIAVLRLQPAVWSRITRQGNGVKPVYTWTENSFFSRAARSLAKSSPAWCEERVSGLDATIRKPLV